MRHISKLFKALSDQNRIRILKMLEIRPLCVCEITEILPISNSTASKHLSILREAGFIYDQKDGKYVEYTLDTESKDPEIRKVLALLPEMCCDDMEVKSYTKKLKTIDRYTVCSVQ
jgi:ArsR family transcriptional regulator, arsenate/arsenite/antimonite-responsive transcriptional repressor